MKLNQYKEKKNHKKILIIIGAIMFFIGGIIVNKTFANFKMQKSFKVMEGNFIYERSGDIIFAFYQGDENVGTMPTKESGYVFDSHKSSCDNNAKINWDNYEWGPNIRNLTKTKTKCNLYFLDIKTLRKINGYSDDTEGMWGYKNKITKIVIEANKNKKEASEGQIVHGPFDESEKKDSSIESYVVCDANDTNCIGYLQGDKGIDLNSDSSYLFYAFENVTQIEGIENLYASNVENMSHMFRSMSSLQTLDLSTFDTSNVINMVQMFARMSNLQTLDISNFYTRNVTNMSTMFYGMKTIQSLNLINFDTSKVTTMDSMFNGMSSIEELDLSSFDTRNVTDMDSMFGGASKLIKITYGPKFVHEYGTTTSNMFTNCPANKPDENVHSSWKGVSFS